MFGATSGTSAPFSFGTPATTTSSLFNFGTPTATTSSAPFGTKTTTTTSAPFSFAPTATTGAATGSLFGKPATTTTTSPFSFGTPTTTTASIPSISIFGPSTTTAAASTSLFGSVGQTTSAPQQAATSAFFGHVPPAPTAGQPAPSTGDAALAQNRDPAYFSSLLERSKKKARLTGIERGGRLAQLPSLNMDLGDLARRAQEIGGRGATPSAGVSDSRAHYLLAGSGVAPGKAYKDFQALKGEDVVAETRGATEDWADESSVYLRDLRSKGREAMMKEHMDRVYREVDAFIEQSLGIDFEEQKVRIMEHFGLVPKEDESTIQDTSRSAGLKGGFGRGTRKAQDDLAESTRPGSRSVFARSAIDKSIIGTPGSTAGTTSFFKGENAPSTQTTISRGQTIRDLRDKERSFVEKVEQLNQARLQEKPFPIMDHFGQVEQSAGADSPRQIFHAYQALREITKESASAVKERQYSEAYLEESPRAAKATNLRKQIVEGARTYLEKAFYRELESTVEKNPREAQLGGRPTVLNKVRAYIRVRVARRSLTPDGMELQQIGEKGDYCWILIFYLLRSGFVKEATEYVNNDAAFQSTDRRFVSYLTTYANSVDRRLSRKLQEMIDGEYQQRAKLAPKGSVDPYRMACYKIVGRCDLSARNLDNVGQNVEDWMWLQFSLARELDTAEELLSGEVFGLDQICETITEIGEKHFQKGQIEGSHAYGTFFLMQILAGMFEQAVDYLHSFVPVSAVHFAIALAYYGLLRVSDFNVAGNELCKSLPRRGVNSTRSPSADPNKVTYSTTQRPLLNFVPLIAHYTAAFRTALPVAAVDYLALICLNSDLRPPNLGLAQTNACHECLRELCLETREFARLLGDIRSDGTRIPGAIEQRAPLIQLDTREDFLASITSQSAAIADQRGQVADAVLLYHLCEDYDNVVVVLNRALADAVSLDLGESPMQLQPLKPRRPNGFGSPVSSGQDGPQSSLSLTQSTSSPMELAKNMISLYDNNAAYYNKISPAHKTTCGALLRLLSVRAHLEAKPPRYMLALEELNDLNILPLRTNGSIPAIRAAASTFGTLPQLLARCAGVSVVWAVRAIGGERDNILRHGSWETGAGGDRDVIKEQLNDMAKDLMVFAGLVKYKLPARVYDMLTRAGGDVGGY